MLVTRGYDILAGLLDTTKCQIVLVELWDLTGTCLYFRIVK